MGNVVFDISISLDGYITAPNDRFEQRLGDEGSCLHNWCRGGEWAQPGRPLTAVDQQVLDELFSAPGAIVMGRRMFDINQWWREDEEPPFGVPIFVVTHRAHDIVVNGATTFMFVTDGIASALEQAQKAAGDKDVSVGGGANIAQQYLKAALIDEIQIHVAPVVLGAGKRLFDHLGNHQISLAKTRVLDSPFATHLRYQILK